MPSNPLEHASIHWDINTADFSLLVEVARRARHELTDYPDDHHTLVMDLNACHSNGCLLDFRGLLTASPFELSHDIYGIREHINRRTGKLENCFVPRYALANRVEK